MYSALVLPVCTTVPQYDTFGTVVQTIAVQVQYIDGTYVLCYYYRYVLPYRSMILSVPQYQSWYRRERQRELRRHTTGTVLVQEKERKRPNFVSVAIEKTPPGAAAGGPSCCSRRTYLTRLTAVGHAVRVQEDGVGVLILLRPEGDLEKG